MTLFYLYIFKILFQNIFILYLPDTFEKYLAQHNTCPNSVMIQVNLQKKNYKHFVDGMHMVL